MITEGLMKKILLIIVIILLPIILIAKDKISLRVLCYHNILPSTKYKYDVSVANFERQMKLLASNGYVTLKASQMFKILKKQIPYNNNKKYVVITFDDGNDGVYKYAMPILKKYKLRATFFIYPSIIFAREQGRRKAFMTWTQIKRLISHPKFELGNHSYYHPYLSKESDSGLRTNIITSTKKLIQKIGYKPLSFAYPFGSSNSRVRAMLKKNGYKVAFGIKSGDVHFKTPLLKIPRFLMLKTISQLTFKEIVSGVHILKIGKGKQRKKIKKS